MADTPLTYEQIEEAAEYIKNASKTTARIAVITGAALGVIPKSCLHGEEIPCGKIPNVGECTEEDCKDCPNVLYAGVVGNAPVIAMTGKAHILSRKTMCKTGLFIKAFKLLGVDTVILIGPAGALNPDYKVGDLMIVKDHVNFMGMAGYNPLIGKNDDRFGPRFLSLNKAYSEQLSTSLNSILQDIGYDGKVHEGIYVGITGPFYPTLAEKEFLRTSSRGDAIGMYLIPEVLLARYCAMNVVAMCLITEECPTETSTKVEESNFENVMIVGEQKIEALNTCIEKMIAQLDVGRPTAKEAEIDTQSTFTAGPCCRCTLGSNITDATNVPYDSIPNFPRSTSTVGQVVAGNIGNTPIVIMQGRYNAYEGFTMQQCTMYIRVLKLMGIQSVIICNVGGGINQDYKVGDIMLIKDHVNVLGFSGQNPLMGPNEDRFGHRYIPLSRAYNHDLLAKAKDVLAEINFEGTVHEGVYGIVAGPAYDTIAENLLLKTSRVDAVGNTIVPEVMVAVHCGMPVLAFVLITDEAVLDANNDKEIDHEGMVETCNKRCHQLDEFLAKFLPGIASVAFLEPMHDEGKPDEGKPDEGKPDEAKPDEAKHDADAVSATTGVTTATADANIATATCCKCKRT